MYLIYMDEAGIDASSPVTVVAAVMVDADKEYRRLLKTLAELVLSRVPQEFVGEFGLHAMELMDPKKYPGWDLDDRYKLLLEFLSIPKRMRLPVVGAVIKRTFEKERIPRDQIITEHHKWAFVECLSKADEGMRNIIGGDTLAMAIADDFNHAPKKEFMRGAINSLRRQSANFGSATHPLTGEKYWPQRRITQIIDSVHFVEKKHALVLQLADACAYAIKRRFGNFENGQELYSTLVSPATPDMESERIAFLSRASEECVASVLVPTDTHVLPPGVINASLVVDPPIQPPGATKPSNPQKEEAPPQGGV